MTEYYNHSIGELILLLFVFSIWFTSVYYWLKRYNKITTIERAYVPNTDTDNTLQQSNLLETSKVSDTSPRHMSQNSIANNYHHKPAQHLLSSENLLQLSSFKSFSKTNLIRANSNMNVTHNTLFPVT